MAIPNTVSATVADPKIASTAALAVALSYPDVVEYSAYDLVAEEYQRRTGDNSYSTYEESPTYY